MRLRSREAMEVTRQHVVEVLQRAGLWEEAEQAKLSLPDLADLDRVAEFLFARGITKDTLVSLLGGSP
jgi:hypothetical protein